MKAGAVGIFQFGRVKKCKVSLQKSKKFPFCKESVTFLRFAGHYV